MVIDAHEARRLTNLGTTLEMAGIFNDIEDRARLGFPYIECWPILETSSEQEFFEETFRVLGYELEKKDDSENKVYHYIISW